MSYYRALDRSVVTRDTHSYVSVQVVIPEDCCANKLELIIDLLHILQSTRDMQCIYHMHDVGVEPGTYNNYVPGSATFNSVHGYWAKAPSMPTLLCL